MASAADEVRRDLCDLIAAGRFASRQDLNAYIASIGLGQVRNGVDYITVQASDGSRARIYLREPLLRPTTDLGPKERWSRDGGSTFIAGAGAPVHAFSVYMIAAVDPALDVAAYVGSATRPHHRFAEHFHGREGTSVDLAAWSHRHRADVYVQELVCTNCRRGAVQLEGYITSELERHGWLLPGVSRWRAATRAAAQMQWSFRNANIVWIPPSIAEIRAWRQLHEYKFYA